MPYTVIISETLDSNYLSNGWVIGGTPTPGTYVTNYPHSWWQGLPILSGHVLFGWLDSRSPLTINASPYVRETYIAKTFTGFNPGEQLGVHLHSRWLLDTGPGNVFMEVNGTRLILPNRGFDLWTIDASLFPGRIKDDVLTVTADANGEVNVKVGGEGYFPSSNVYVDFSGLFELVAFEYHRVYGFIQKRHGVTLTPAPGLDERAIVDSNDVFVFNSADSRIYVKSLS